MWNLLAATDTGIVIDGFYVFLLIVEIVLELALLWAVWLYLPRLLDACEVVKRSFIIDGPKEIANRIVEKLSETKVVVTATGSDGESKSVESVGGESAKTIYPTGHSKD